MSAVLLLAAACTRAVPPPSTAPVRIPIAPPPALPLPVVGGDAKFQAFVRDFEGVALANGVTAQTYNRAMTGIAPIPSIAQANANQPEFSKPVWSYLDSAVSARRIHDAQVMFAAKRDILADIERSSGVPAEILVAIWGMETDFGHDTGGLNLFAALATLGYDGPRQAYARPELLAALQILQRQNYPPSEMVGSWAGAFGQTQFTPTTFLKYATDGDGDGHIDLWHSSADALASAAAMLAQSGWASGKSWGYEVKLPHGFAYEEADPDTVKSIADWRARGVKTMAGGALPRSDDDAALYLPAGARGPAFLLLPNFKIILKYNNADSYALAVGLLADRMAGAPAIVASWPRDERPLARSERIALQTDLKTLGFDAGEADGVLGRKTRAALRLYQKSRGLPADGFATAKLLTLIEKNAGG